jgi:hypothetical protein
MISLADLGADDRQQRSLVRNARTLEGFIRDNQTAFSPPA